MHACRYYPENTQLQTFKLQWTQCTVRRAGKGPTFIWTHSKTTLPQVELDLPQLVTTRGELPLSQEIQTPYRSKVPPMQDSHTNELRGGSLTQFLGGWIAQLQLHRTCVNLTSKGKSNFHF